MTPPSASAALATVPETYGRAEVRERLAAVNWDFVSRAPADALESVHPYPAKFVGDLPRAVIGAIAPAPGTVVLDPFVGSGTTLVESQRVGLRGVGVDLNPIACLMSRVKTGELPSDLERVALATFDRALGLDSPIPDIPRLDHWFEASVQAALANLVEAITHAPAHCRDHLRLALSSIIVRVSNQDSDTRYAAVKRNVSDRAVYEAFLNAVARLVRALKSRAYLLRPMTVIQANTLTLDVERIGGQIGLVITSPPYPNAYEYWLYHKYRMWWLGYDALDVKEQEIGARAHFFKKHHHTKDDFARQMSQTFCLLSQLMSEGAYAIFVVGRSKIHGEIVDNAELTRVAARAADLNEVFSTDRTIQSNRKSFNLSHANIKTETVLAFCK